MNVQELHFRLQVSGDFQYNKHVKSTNIPKQWFAVLI